MAMKDNLLLEFDDACRFPSKLLAKANNEILGIVPDVVEIEPKRI